MVSHGCISLLLERKNGHAIECQEPVNRSRSGSVVASFNGDCVQPRQTRGTAGDASWHTRWRDSNSRRRRAGLSCQSNPDDPVDGKTQTATGLAQTFATSLVPCKPSWFAFLCGAAASHRINLFPTSVGQNGSTLSKTCDMIATDDCGIDLH